MYEIWIIARNDIEKILRNGSTYLSFVYMLIASAVYIGNYTSINGGLAAQGASSQAIYHATRSYLDAGLFLWPLAYSLLAASFGSYVIVLEKNNRNFEQLMVSPVSIRQIWAGKSLGMTVAGIILGLSFYLLVFLSMTFILVIPKTGAFVMPDWLPIITAIIIAPILALGVITLAVRIQLTIANPRTANVIFIVIMVGIVVVMAVFTIVYYSRIDYFDLVYLGAIVVVGALLRLASHSLTAEKVILSSKG